MPELKVGDRVRHSHTAVKGLYDWWKSAGTRYDEQKSRKAQYEAKIAERGTITAVTHKYCLGYEILWDENCVHGKPYTSSCMAHMVDPADSVLWNPVLIMEEPPATKPKRKKKKEITLDQVMAACQSSEYLGFCKACGHEQEGCEPDARNYLCEECGERQVFGAEELLIEMA